MKDIVDLQATQQDTSRPSHLLSFMRADMTFPSKGPEYPIFPFSWRPLVRPQLVRNPGSIALMITMYQRHPKVGTVWLAAGHSPRRLTQGSVDAAAQPRDPGEFCECLNVGSLENL